MVEKNANVIRTIKKMTNSLSKTALESIVNLIVQELKNSIGRGYIDQLAILGNQCFFMVMICYLNQTRSVKTEA